MFGKRGVEIGTIFIFIIAIVVGAMTVLFGVKVYHNLTTAASETEFKTFTSELMKDINVEKRKYGSPVLHTYRIPDIVKYIVFVDLSDKERVMNNSLVKQYPLILDAIKDDVKKNMYIIKNDGSYSSFYLGEIIIAKIGEENCTGVGVIEARGGSFELKMRGKGGEAYLGENCEGLFYREIELKKEYKTFNALQKQQFELKNDALVAGKILGSDEYIEFVNLTSSPVELKGVLSFNDLVLKKDVPLGTSLRFQLETSATPDFIGNFTGPDGTNTSYYTTSGERISQRHWRGQKMYLKFKALFESQKTQSPALKSLMFGYYRNQSAGP